MTTVREIACGIERCDREVFTTSWMVLGVMQGKNSSAISMVIRGKLEVCDKGIRPEFQGVSSGGSMVGCVLVNNDSSNTPFVSGESSFWVDWGASGSVGTSRVGYSTRG